MYIFICIYILGLVTSKDMQTPFPPPPSEFLLFSRKMRTVLNRMKNQFSDFFNFYLSNYRENSLKIVVIFSTKITITRTI